MTDDHSDRARLLDSRQIQKMFCSQSKGDGRAVVPRQHVRTQARSPPTDVRPRTPFLMPLVNIEAYAALASSLPVRSSSVSIPLPLMLLRVVLVVLVVPPLPRVLGQVQRRRKQRFRTRQLPKADCWCEHRATGAPVVSLMERTLCGCASAGVGLSLTEKERGVRHGPGA